MTTRKTATGPATEAPTDTPDTGAQGTSATPAAPRLTKAAQVHGLLARPESATLDALCTATGWQPHTARAALSRLRKAGRAILRAPDAAGQTVYRLEGPLPDAPGRPEEMAHRVYDAGSFGPQPAPHAGTGEAGA